PMIEERHASARFARLLCQLFENRVGQAGLERFAAGRADAEAVSLDGTRRRRIPLENLDGDAGAFQPLRQTEAADPGADDGYFESVHDCAPLSMIRRRAPLARPAAEINARERRQVRVRYRPLIYYLDDRVHEFQRSRSREKGEHARKAARPEEAR